MGARYKKSDLASAGVWGHFHRIFSNFGKSKELRRNIKNPGELVMFIFHFPKTQNVLMFMIFGPSGNVHDPQNCCLLWARQITFVINTTKYNIIEQTLFGEISATLESFFSKRRARGNP